MQILWRKPDRATVEDVRQELPPERNAAYTTVQTVLNRLSERGLVQRHSDARAIKYDAAISEADYLSRSLRNTLDGASSEARRSALASLADDLDPSELESIRKMAEQVRDRRS